MATFSPETKQVTESSEIQLNESENEIEIENVEQKETSDNESANENQLK